MAKIIITDDEPMNRRMTEFMLTKNGYETVKAASGEECLSKLSDGADLVLLDVMMPDMDGYEVLEYMNFNGVLKRTPAIMVTGADSAEDEEKCLRMGAMDFVRKPYVTDVKTAGKKRR